jgi:hypothetical protein
MAVDEHIHCAECLKAVPLVQDASGLTPEEAQKVMLYEGIQLRVVPGPNGAQAQPMKVPLCYDCFTRVQAMEKSKAGKIIVPASVAADRAMKKGAQ